MNRLKTLRVVTLCCVVAAIFLLPPPAPAAPTNYVTLSDGVSIAVSIHFPEGYDPARQYPAIFEMSGYDGGSAQGRTLSGEMADRTGQGNNSMWPLKDDSRQLTEEFTRSGYVVMHASVRGSGCSGGEFDLFSYKSALDGYELIEWMAGQPWSNGKIGIMGHSYSGITGFMVAATQPPHLEAVTVSGLIDDVYRGLVYPGGVTNFGFPMIWSQGVRTFYDLGGGLLPGVVRPIDRPGEQNPQCARNAASKSRTVVDDPLIKGTTDTDSDWFRARSLINYAQNVGVPIHITGSHQDEQTGPRGAANLWEKVAGVPKRMILTNGNHDADWTPEVIMRDRVAWMDHWIKGIDGGFGPREESTTTEQICEPKPGNGREAPKAKEKNCETVTTTRPVETSVTNLFELSVSSGKYSIGARKDSRTFPLEDTIWTNLFFRDSGVLSSEAPTSQETPDRYVTSKRQSWSYQAGTTAGSEFTGPPGPDEVNYTSPPLEKPMMIAGPITATIHLATSSIDTEMMVQLIDVGPDGSRSYIQRGVLRASHRLIDESKSDFTADGYMYRPFRPHTNPTNVIPGEINEYVVEIWPAGHIFRPGHKVRVQVLAPSAVDSYYAYLPKASPSVNTVHHDRVARSRITLPVVPFDGALGPELRCGEQFAVRCIR